MTITGLPLLTCSLVIRHLVPEDAAALLALSNESLFREFLPSQVYRDEAEAGAAVDYLVRQYPAADPRLHPYVLGVEHRTDSILIGHVGFSRIEEDVEVGFAIGERYQRRGLASEAVAAASRWALEAFGLKRILGITAAANVGSKGAMLRAGYVHERDRVLTFQGAEQVVSVYVLGPTEHSTRTETSTAPPPAPCPR